MLAEKPVQHYTQHLRDNKPKVLYYDIKYDNPYHLRHQFHNPTNLSSSDVAVMYSIEAAGPNHRYNLNLQV